MSELLIIPIRHPFFPGLTFDLPLSSLPAAVRSGLQAQTFKRLPYAGLFLHRKDQRVEERAGMGEKAVAGRGGGGGGESKGEGKGEGEEGDEEKAEIAELSGVEDVHSMGVMVQFVVMGDRVKGNVHSRVRIKAPVVEKAKDGSSDGGEEREKRPLYAHVEHIEEHEQKKKTQDSSVNANTDDAITQQPPATTSSSPSPSASPSPASPPAEPTLRIGSLNDTDFNAYIKELASTMQELAQSTDIQKRSLLVQQRLINATIDNINASRLADVYASFARATPAQLQTVLEEVDAGERLLKVLVLLKREQEEVKIQMSIMSKIQEKMGQQQHKHLLKEQKKMIDHMLGHGKGDKQSLLSKYEQRLKGKVVPPAVKAVLDEELGKLQAMEGESQDFNLVKNYLDWLTVVPWGVYTSEQYSITHAERILQADHYGLDDVKQRILELIATSSLLGHVPNTKTICLVGPPGVGQ